LEIQAQVGTNLRVESQDALGAPWQLMQAITNVSENPVRVSDSGQNGRLPTSQAPSRFYRVSNF
jgi:hypothetical protein